MTNGSANAYLRTKVMTASPEELRLMLLDGAIKFARQGREGLEAKNFEQSFSGISQCRAIVVELMTSVRPEVDPELIERVRSLYTYLFSQLTEAGLEKSPRIMDHVIELLEYERETWVMLMDQLTEARAQGRDPVAEARASLDSAQAAAPATQAGRADPRPRLSVQA
ncbi:MAG: flagellar export chaperone FliS [Phycisphaerales bacterium]|nr:MAG: flagellar export chaperone FliS [Phycisphaerales bacterium]